MPRYRGEGDGGPSFERMRGRHQPRTFQEHREIERVLWMPIEALVVASSQVLKTDRMKVNKHRAIFEAGEDIEPIDVVAVNLDGQIKYRVAGNGRHRYLGAREAGLTMVPVRIHDSRLEQEEKKEAA